MKIIQTPARFYPYTGGTEKVCFYLSRELVKKGHSVKVICANEPATRDSVLEGIEIRRLPYIAKVCNTNITLSLGKELWLETCDIMHTHLPHPWSADVSAFIALLKNKPLFLTYHNDITARGISKFIAGFYNFSALKFLLKRANKIFIYHENYLKSSPFLKPYRNKIVILPPGVDLEKFKPLGLNNTDKANKVIFFLSILDRFHFYKGLDYLLQAVKKITSKIPLKLYVGGSGELLNYYKEFVERNGLEETVHFLGFLDDETLLRYYNLCDVFVLPSISSAQEGFGLAALEAMACKKPVIVTDITGVAEDIQRQGAGVVVKPRNIDALSEALVYLLSNENGRKTMGDNAYRLVKENYTWQRYADITEKEYLDI